MTAPDIRPLDPQPLDYTNGNLGTMVIDGSLLPFNRAEIEGCEVKVMRLHDWAEPQAAAAGEEAGSVSIEQQWMNVFKTDWDQANPVHPFESNPWVAVLMPQHP